MATECTYYKPCDVIIGVLGIDVLAFVVENEWWTLFRIFCCPLQNSIFIYSLGKSERKQKAGMLDVFVMRGTDRC